MKHFISYSSQLIVDHKNKFFCVLIAVIGAILRLYHYDTLPPYNWTADEFAFAWSGMSLIQNHEPTAWSFLAPTDDFPVVVWEANGVRYRLVTPWFDHPPLFGLIVGFTAILGGAKEFFDCSLTVIRIPSLIMGISSIILLYWVSLKLFNTQVAVITSLIFATNPNTVFLSRLVVSENLILLLSLGVLLLFLKSQETEKTHYFYGAIILAGIAPLVKVTGIFLSAFLAGILIYQKRWKESILAGGMGVLGFSLYYLYGWIYDFEFFTAILNEQKNRFLDFAILKYLLVPTVFFEDGWLSFSWLILLFFISSNLDIFKTRLLILPVLIYSLLLVSSGAQSHYYAWYTIPFYPFMFIILGKFLSDFQEKPGLLNAGFIYLFIAVWCIEMNIGKWIIDIHNGKYYFILFTGFTLLIYWLDELTKRKTKKLTNWVSLIIFATLIIANINVALTYKI